MLPCWAGGTPTGPMPAAQLIGTLCPHCKPEIDSTALLY